MRWQLRCATAATILVLLFAGGVAPQNQRGARRFPLSTPDENLREEDAPSHRHHSRDTTRRSDDIARREFHSRDAELVPQQLRDRSSGPTRSSYRSRNEVSPRDSLSRKEIPIVSSNAAEYERLQVPATRRSFSPRAQGSNPAEESKSQNDDGRTVSNESLSSRRTVSGRRDKNGDFARRGGLEERKTATAAPIDEPSSQRSFSRVPASGRNSLRGSSQTETANAVDTQARSQGNRGKSRAPEGNLEPATRTSPRLTETRGRSGGQRFNARTDESITETPETRNRDRTSSRGSSDVPRTSFRNRDSAKDEEQRSRASAYHSRTEGSSQRSKTLDRLRSRPAEGATAPAVTSPPQEETISPTEKQDVVERLEKLPEFPTQESASSAAAEDVTTPVPDRGSRSTVNPLSRGPPRGGSNRGRGTARATTSNLKSEGSKEKETDDVDEDDNYPEVYKQLKKSGTDPKDILVPKYKQIISKYMKQNKYEVAATTRVPLATEKFENDFSTETIWKDFRQTFADTTTSTVVPITTKRGSFKNVEIQEKIKANRFKPSRPPVDKKPKFERKPSFTKISSVQSTTVAPDSNKITSDPPRNSYDQSKRPFPKNHKYAPETTANYPETNFKKSHPKTTRTPSVQVEENYPASTVKPAKKYFPKKQNSVAEQTTLANYPEIPRAKPYPKTTKTPSYQPEENYAPKSRRPSYEPTEQPFPKVSATTQTPNYPEFPVTGTIHQSENQDLKTTTTRPKKIVEWDEEENYPKPVLRENIKPKSKAPNHKEVFNPRKPTYTSETVNARKPVKPKVNKLVEWSSELNPELDWVPVPGGVPKRKANKPHRSQNSNNYNDWVPGAVSDQDGRFYSSKPNPPKFREHTVWPNPGILPSPTPNPYPHPLDHWQSYVQNGYHDHFYPVQPTYQNGLLPAKTAHWPTHSYHKPSPTTQQHFSWNTYSPPPKNYYPAKPQSVPQASYWHGTNSWTPNTGARVSVKFKNDALGHWGMDYTLNNRNFQERSYSTSHVMAERSASEIPQIEATGRREPKLKAPKTEIRDEHGWGRRGITTTSVPRRDPVLVDRVRKASKRGEVRSAEVDGGWIPQDRSSGVLQDDSNLKTPDAPSSATQTSPEFDADSYEIVKNAPSKTQKDTNPAITQFDITQSEAIFEKSYFDSPKISTAQDSYSLHLNGRSFRKIGRNSSAANLGGPDKSATPAPAPSKTLGRPNFEPVTARPSVKPTRKSVFPMGLWESVTGLDYGLYTTGKTDVTKAPKEVSKNVGKTSKTQNAIPETGKYLAESVNSLVSDSVPRTRRVQTFTSRNHGETTTEPTSTKTDKTKDQNPKAKNGGNGFIQNLVNIFKKFFTPLQPVV
ncbi:Hypothetical protein NTJ_12111 [Nesidiocoris tenuis]|uniref:Uncharacterized protein n=1 Tax=Nesidiocoris tenuis TaxID=355587 RepID=A0ABN7B4H5_9HEMI|nr:Hypothetical protein NTJ_12111 [Nesidiocoris tenuis]